ncbi:mediator of RNA polymerase II transcription subunit 14 [Chlorella sorokiniana]|uniref:Mediator of RNA polymerase II transcription subunit 14 n=1 Tax=Chlorella sorokiniana TaxID=3076 RepID=A0A2P6TKJ3_CHLSO|nr:mediator of RNA polymerase II transcription subunit 14 [Chlorella sorokiniana]|eukprot:PRW44595.1 mediator of RNA polymerase II transcription subunit 14 [Chlorella sorokiniana]
MLGAVGRLFGFGSAAAGCGACDPEVLAKCSAPQPGDVKAHSHHVFVKLPAPSGSSGATDEGWWPESVDAEPTIKAVTTAIKEAGAAINGAVKVTAFDRLTSKALAPGSCDVLVLGAGAAGVGLQSVPLDRLPAVVLAALTGGDAAAAAGPDAQSSEDVADTVLVVCCHVARDERCGHIGPPLADKLAELAGTQAATGGVRVLKSSHIGGHKYAGNVIAYTRQDGAFQGNWFGGLNPGNANEFLTALFACKAPHGPAGDRVLRKYWRGCVGLSKEQQLERFEHGLKDIEDMGLPPAGQAAMEQPGAHQALDSLKLVPFRDVLENVCQEAHAGLQALADRLPALDDQQRKAELLQHLQTTQQRLQRLHVCAQWAHKAKAVNTCREVLKASQDHSAALVHAADEFFRLHEELRFVRAPLFDVGTALHILQSGNYRVLPSVIEEELVQPGQRLERPGEVPEVVAAEQQQAATRRIDFLLRSKLLTTELPPGLRVVRVRGGVATVAATGGQYTACLTLVPSPRDDVTLAKYRPPGEPEDAAAAAVKEEPEVTQPVAGPSAAAADGGQPSTSAAAAGPLAGGDADQRQGTDCWRWQLLSFELLPAAAGQDPPPLLAPQQQWLQQHVEQRMWVAADMEQLVRLGKQAWVTVPAAPKEQQEQGRASSAPAPTTSMAPSQLPAAADSKGKQPMAVDGEPEAPLGEQQGAAAAQLPAYAARPLAAMHAVLCQSAGRLALFSLLLSDARRLEGGSWKGGLKLSRAAAGAGIRLAYWLQLPSMGWQELQCLRDGTPFQPTPTGATAAATAGPQQQQQQQQQQQPEPPAVDVVVREDGNLAASSSPQLHHPLSGEAVQLPLPLDSAASFGADRLLLQAAACSAAVQLAAVQAVLQRRGHLAANGTHAELSLAAPLSPAAGAGVSEAPLPTSPSLLLWSSGSVQLSLGMQLRTGRLLLAAGPAVLESEQGSSAQAAVAAAQQQLDQLQRDALLQPLPPGTSRGMLAARLAADAVARLSLQLSVQRRMDAAAAAAAGFGMARAALPQRLLQQHMGTVSLLLAPLSGNTLTLALPAHQPPRDLARWASRQQAQQQQQGGGNGSGPGSVAESGATRCFMLLDFGDASTDAVKEEQPAVAAGAAAPQLRVLLATCACTSRGTATRVVQLAELPQQLLQAMRQAADGSVSASSRKRRASDAAEQQTLAAAAAAAGDGEMELGLAAAAAWCKRQAGESALRAQLQLLPTQHMEELSLTQPQRPAIRLPHMPVLAQLDAWAAKQLQVAGSSGAASSWGASNGGEQPGTPAGVDAAAQLGPPKPAATIQLEEGEAEAEAGQWRIQLSSLYFARLAQLLQRHGMALAPPADDVQHVTPTAAGLTLAYSLQKGRSVLTGISDIARLGMMQLCLIRLLGYMAANPLAAGAAAAVSATGGSNGTLLQPNGALTPAGKGAAGPVWPLPGCGSVRLAPVWAAQLWQRLQLEVPAFATVQPPAGANGEQRQAVLQAWVPWQGLPLALAHLMRAVAAAK